MEYPPEAIEPELKRYLIKVLEEHERRLNGKDTIAATTVIPTKPVTGRIYFFPNTTGAITSAGIWTYYGGAWAKLG
jgi:hypothetical protein